MERQERRLRVAVGLRSIEARVLVLYVRRRGQCGGMFLLLCVLIGRLPGPGVSPPAPLAGAAEGGSGSPKILKINLEGVCVGVCWHAHILHIQCFLLAEVAVFERIFSNTCKHYLFDVNKNAKTELSRQLMILVISIYWQPLVITVVNGM